MIDWVVETFSLLLSGVNQLLTAALRLCLVAFVLLIVWACISAVIKNPKTSITMILYFTVAMVVGFGIPLLAIQFSDNDLVHIISAVAGLVACMNIISLGEKFFGDKNDKA